MVKFEEFPTYTYIAGEMVHTGYLIVSPDHRLKQTLKGCWDEIKSRPDFTLSLNKYVGRLQDAQSYEVVA